jgi:hypothetical protein
MEVNMTQFFTVLLIALMFLKGNAQGVFLNEIRSNDDGTDDAEFVELVGPAGFDLTGWQIAHINGSDGSTIFSFTFPAGTIIPDDGVTNINGQNIGFLVIKRTGHMVNNFDFEWGSTALQNGPDGLLLSDDEGTRIQALTWNGSASLTGGEPAWRNIGNDNDDDNSLSAPDTLEESYHRDWAYVLPTPGSLNANQTRDDVTLPVQLTSFRAIAADRRVTLVWITEAELDNLGFIIERSMARERDYIQIASYESMPALAGSGNSSTRRNYQFVDTAVFNGLTYWYRLIDVSASGLRTAHPAVSATPDSPSEIEDPVKVNEGEKLPADLHLNQNYPNPFNPETRINFFIPHDNHISSRINLSVYDLNGKIIRTLVDEDLSPGNFAVIWDGKDQQGFSVAGGIYFYILRAKGNQLARKMFLLR